MTVAIEPLAWERFRVAALIHDQECIVHTWLAKQDAYHEWVKVFLADKSKAPLRAVKGR